MSSRSSPLHADRTMIRKLYEKYLEDHIDTTAGKVPAHVTMVLSEADLLHPAGASKLDQVVRWCSKIGIEVLSFYIEVLDIDEELQNEMVEKLIDQLKKQIDDLPSGIDVTIYDEQGRARMQRKGKTMSLYLCVGLGGRSEITKAVCSLLHDVKEGKLLPDNIDEHMIESYLVVKEEPDLIVRAGGKHLSDFLIWQSVYSELYFTDVNWYELRKIDLLRIIRDYQKRQRRYGK